MTGGEAGGLLAAVEQRLAALDRERVAARLWAADPTLWKPEDAGHQEVIANALGWLTVFDDVADQLDDLAEFVAEVRDDGLRHAVLLGMGGSSLAPEVLAFAFGAGEDGLDLTVLDTTDPAAIVAVEDRVDLLETLFIVSSKSGGTTETASLHAYFYERVHDELGHETAGRHFIAITDEGTSLQKLAEEQEFRAIFLNPADIGGRYSALSFFGLVPAALLGLDVDELLDRARAMAARCGADVPAAENPALRLGAFLGEGGLAGRDKVTLVTPPVVGNFGSWLEQLIAESTGKEGTGLFPVDVEPLGPPEVYGGDRQFVALRVQDEHDGGQAGKLATLEEAGYPVERLDLADIYDIGAQFVLWELAVPVAGMILGIDPFDQPNVQESKDNTRRVLADLEKRGAVPLPAGPGGEAVAFALGEHGLEAALRELVGEIAPPDYVTLQAWLTPGNDPWLELQAMRVRLRDRRKVATSEGFGPRFLHSTGQYHKGGARTGVFLQLYAGDGPDLPVPGRPYDFAQLKHAQALGDLEALIAHGGRVLRADLGDDAVAGLRAFRALLERVLG